MSISTNKESDFNNKEKQLRIEKKLENRFFN